MHEVSVEDCNVGGEEHYALSSLRPHWATTSAHVPRAVPLTHLHGHLSWLPVPNVDRSHLTLAWHNVNAFTVTFVSLDCTVCCSLMLPVYMVNVILFIKIKKHNYSYDHSLVTQITAALGVHICYGFFLWSEYLITEGVTITVQYNS